ncbi:hypothetical protein FQZ97_608560 [compost metagenome]
MADEDDGDAGGGKTANDIEQVIGFRLGQRCGRLVHEDELRFADESPGDRHDLALGDCVFLEWQIDVERHAEAGERILRDLAHAAVVDKLWPATEHRLEGDILGNAHLREERQILPDHLDAAVLRRHRRHVGVGFAIELDRSAIGGVIDAGDDLDQRALAAAVFAGKAMNFARAHVEAHILERSDATESHVDVAQGQKRPFASSRGRKLVHVSVPVNHVKLERDAGGKPQTRFLSPLLYR